MGVPRYIHRHVRVVDIANVSSGCMHPRHIYGRGAAGVESRRTHTTNSETVT